MSKLKELVNKAGALKLKQLEYERDNQELRLINDNLLSM